MSTALAESTADIWSRTIKPGEGNLTTETAHFFLGIHLSEPDGERLKELSAKARAGSLDPTERRELDHYLDFGWFLDFMKSKARGSLKTANGEEGS
jgi:hypothetical protein